MAPVSIPDSLMEKLNVDLQMMFNMSLRLNSTTITSASNKDLTDIFRFSWETASEKHELAPSSIEPVAESDLETSGILLREAYETKDWRKILASDLFFEEGTFDLSVFQSQVTSTELVENVPESSSENATVQSWEEKFRGTSHDLLRNFMVDAMGPYTDNYARYTAIVQSSGMGKSRLTDELAKTMFTIPINLRDPSTDGYPPPDKCVRNFLIVENIVNQKTAFIRSCAFLAALFDVIRRWVKFTAPGDSIASVFRQEMRDGMRFEEHGPFRTAFFQEVVRTAEDYLKVPQPTEKCPPAELSPEEHAPQGGHPLKTSSEKEPAADRPSSPTDVVQFLSGPRTREGLPQSLQPFQNQDTTKVQSDVPTHKQYLQSLVGELMPAEGPLIILVFDEAHDLTDVHTNRRVPPWSRFGELQRALDQVQKLPLFSLFLSTAGRFHHFTPTRAMDLSARIQHGSFHLLEPFVELDFDTFAQAVGPGKCRLEDVEKTCHLVSLGRPLFYTRYHWGSDTVKTNIVGFASDKVLGPAKGHSDTWKGGLKGELACFAARFPLRFNYLNSTARKLEQDLMTNHMRVCVGVTRDMEYIYTVSPSEPILAEGARVAMEEMDLSEALKHFFDSSILDAGTSAELMVAVQLMSAQDDSRNSWLEAGHDEPRRSVSLHDFLRQLLGSEVQQAFWVREPSCVRTLVESERMPLGQRYPNARVWFNHFVHIEDYQVLDSEYLWAFLLRGTAIVCAANQYGCDMVIPFICDDKKAIGPDNVSAILVQVKNDFKYSASVHRGLFDKMDPYKLKVLPHAKRDEQCHAVVRIIYALTASGSGCMMVELAKRQSKRVKNKKGAQATTQEDTQEDAPDQFRASPCTAFDFWCYGATGRTFNTMADHEVSNYDHILRLSLRRMRIFSTFGPQFKNRPHLKAREQSRRMLHPTMTIRSSHWMKWAKIRHQKYEEEVEDIDMELGDISDDDGEAMEVDLE